MSSYWLWNSCKRVPAGLRFDYIFCLLTVPSRYRPYKSGSMQILSCSCAVVLVLICGLLLRSLVLISAARSPNFDTSNPSIERSSVSEELVPVVSLLIFLLTTPLILVIIMMLRQHLIAKKFAKSVDEASAKSKQMCSPQLSHSHSAIESSYPVSFYQEIVAIDLTSETTEKHIPSSPINGASVSLSENRLRWSPPFAEPWPFIRRRTDQQQQNQVS